MPGERQRGLEQRRAHRVRQVRGRRFLDDLLVVALDRAIALVEVQDAAVAVADDLHLEMARGGDEPLEKDRVVPEGHARLASGAGEGGTEIGGLRNHPHAASAPARRRLDEHWPADPLRLGREALRRLVLAQVARHRRHAGRVRDLLRLDLRAHRRDRVRARPDEDDPLRLAAAHKGRVLRQEAVAGMDRVRAALPDRPDHGVDVEVAQGRGGRAEPVRLVGRADVQRVPVGIRVHGDRAQAETAAGAEDAAGDLAAIGDEHRTDRPGSGGEVHPDHILYTGRGSRISGRIAPVARHRARTARVSRGSMMPSSQSLAVQ